MKVKLIHYGSNPTKKKTVLEENDFSKQNNTYKIEPSLKKRCLDCKKMLTVKFSPPHQQYSKKNDWGGWTGKKEFEGKYKCDFCIFTMFKHQKLKYLREVTNSSKRRLLRSYFYDKKIQTSVG